MISNIFSFLCIVVVLLSCPSMCFPNNVSVADMSLGSIDLSGSPDYAIISFDVTWENSWRVSTPPSNWDAVWLFVKFSKDGGTTWEHASLNDSGHIVPTGMTVETGLVDTESPFNAVTNPGVGTFLFRSNDGHGTVMANGVGLRWNFSVDGVLTSDNVLIQVHAIEVVFVPEGPFFAGDNASTNAAFRQGFSDSDPWYIGSENALNVTNAPGSGTGVGQTNAEFYYVRGSYGGGDPTGSAFVVPAQYPKGFQALYVMKYEITQAGWVAFFNTLTVTQKSARDITAGSYNSTGKASDSIVNRNNVNWPGGVAQAVLNGGTHGDVAMNFLSWADLRAYLDWAGLRPMSELEYEKTGRGSGQPATASEYAWGTTSIEQADAISNAGMANEAAITSGSHTPPPAAANCNYNNDPQLNGPLRVGSFASTGTVRADSGASFYGVMELSGNLWERTISVGDSIGRSFSGTHGDGRLTTAGDADVATWPGILGNQGASYRGAAWRNVVDQPWLSHRAAASLDTTIRERDVGGRGVRTRP